ncbi:beta-galactosidase/beta-glucuronidase domain protein, partial [Vibrio parahaemolyticus V-223/04]
MVSGIYDPIQIDVVTDIWLKNVSTEQQWQADGSVILDALVEVQTDNPSHHVTV